MVTNLKKAQILTDEQVETFLNTASDDDYLAIKVVLIFGVLDALRIDEMVNIIMAHITDHNGLYLISIPKTKNKLAKSFTIHHPYYEIVQKYMKLRPAQANTDRFFMRFEKKKCYNQPIGKNKLAQMPRLIAEYLNLPNPKLYTGHSFQRTSASLLANAGADISTIKRHGCWKSLQIAEGYIENSINYKNKTGNFITSNINLASETKSVPTSSPILPTTTRNIQNTVDNSRKFEGTAKHTIRNDNNNLVVEEPDICSTKSAANFVHHNDDDYNDYIEVVSNANTNNSMNLYEMIDEVVFSIPAQEPTPTYSSNFATHDKIFQDKISFSNCTINNFIVNIYQQKAATDKNSN